MHMRVCFNGVLIEIGGRWEDSAAWIMCTLDANRCTEWDIPLAPMAREAAWNYSQVIQDSRASDAGMDLWHAHQFCFVVTMGQALPWFFLVIAVLYVGINMVKIPFVILSAGVQFLVQALSFTHAE